MTFSQISLKGRGNVARNVAGGLVVALCLGTLAACETDAPTSARVTVESVSFAKGGTGGGGGGGTTAPTVGSLLPTSAAQDTTIDVTIYGTGFTSGAAATWSLAGDTTKVHVKSTRFVSSGQLIARVVVPVDAPVASYDVVVSLIGGKKGVGAELFEVLLGDPAATFLFPMADGGLSVKSDRLYVTGEYSAYANGVCGVNAKIFAGPTASNSGDAIMHTNNARFADRKCPRYPRTLTLVYPDGATETSAVFINVRQIANTEYSIPMNTTVTRSFALNLGTRCGKLLFSGEQQGVPINGDSVFVTRVASDAWRVRTQPDPNNLAYCTATGESFKLSLDFTVVSNRPLP
jgi:hypothetical protein